MVCDFDCYVAFVVCLWVLMVVSVRGCCVFVGVCWCLLGVCGCLRVVGVCGCLRARLRLWCGCRVVAVWLWCVYLWAFVDFLCECVLNVCLMCFAVFLVLLTFLNCFTDF